MKTNSAEKKEKEENLYKSTQKAFNPLVSEEETHLTADDINALVDKYKDIQRKPTIIGEKPYKPFLAGIKEDTWMSVGEEFKEK